MSGGTDPGAEDPLAAVPASGERPPWKAFQAALADAGFRPSKARGQNFLLDANLVRAIARDAQVEPSELVLEVGPGCGFLTRELAELGARVLAVEIDPLLARIAQRHLARFPNVTLVVADVLAGKHGLAPAVTERLPDREPWSLAANLPYAVAGPLLVVLSRLAHPPRAMTVLVQLEVAERLAAAPGGHAWGALTARLARLYRARLVRHVRPELFWPRPRVESALVRLEELAPPGQRPGPAELARYDRLVEVLFQGRRKSLRRLLGDALGGAGPAAAVLGAAGIEGSRRPEGLSVAELTLLAEAPGWGAAAGP